MLTNAAPATCCCPLLPCRCGEVLAVPRRCTASSGAAARHCQQRLRRVRGQGLQQARCKDGDALLSTGAIPGPALQGCNQASPELGQPLPAGMWLLHVAGTLAITCFHLFVRSISFLCRQLPPLLLQAMEIMKRRGCNMEECLVLCQQLAAYRDGCGAYGAAAGGPAFSLEAW